MENTNYIKIGITNDVSKRLETLQTGNPLKLNIEFVSTFDDAQKIETLVHRRFKSKRLMGEWFDMDAKEVVRFLKESKWN